MYLKQTKTEGGATLAYVIPITLRLDAIIVLNVQMTSDAILIDCYCSEGHFHFTIWGSKKFTKLQQKCHLHHKPCL